MHISLKRHKSVDCFGEKQELLNDWKRSAGVVYDFESGFIRASQQFVSWCFSSSPDSCGAGVQLAEVRETDDGVLLTWVRLNTADL